MKALDLTGMTFGKLTVLSFSAAVIVRGISRRMWKCRCQCGQEINIRSISLTGGNTTSCGCGRIEAITTHGRTHSLEYQSWVSMRQRCENPNADRYPEWGGRGIKVCARWQIFEHFLADMGPRHSKAYSIDRINNDGDYEPGNCRWATRSQQQRNKRRSNHRKEIPC